MPDYELLATPLNERNGDPRVACVVLADVSYSMSGEPLAALEAGFAQFVAYLNDDPLARKRVEVGVVAFGSHAEVLVQMQEGRSLEPIRFEANGSTNMAEGINVALDMIEGRKDEYRDAGLEYFRPWLLVFTDGAPDPGDAFGTAVTRLNAVETQKGVTVFPVGVGSAVDFETLGKLSTVRTPVAMSGLKFTEMFEWLSSSLSSVSQSDAHSNSGGADTTTQVHLPSPAGWATA